MTAEQGKPNPCELHLDCVVAFNDLGAFGDAKFTVLCGDNHGCLAFQYMEARAALLGRIAKSARNRLNSEPNMSGHVIGPNTPTTVTAEVGGHECGENCPQIPPDDQSVIMRFHPRQNSGMEGAK